MCRGARRRVRPVRRRAAIGRVRSSCILAADVRRRRARSALSSPISCGCPRAFARSGDRAARRGRGLRPDARLRTARVRHPSSDRQFPGFFLGRRHRAALRTADGRALSERDVSAAGERIVRGRLRTPRARRARLPRDQHAGVRGDRTLARLARGRARAPAAARRGRGRLRGRIAAVVRPPSFLLGDRSHPGASGGPVLRRVRRVRGRSGALAAPLRGGRRRGGRDGVQGDRLCGTALGGRRVRALPHRRAGRTRWSGGGAPARLAARHRADRRRRDRDARRADRRARRPGRTPGGGGRCGGARGRAGRRARTRHGGSCWFRSRAAR